MDAATRDRHQRVWLSSSSVGVLALLLLVACGASARPLQAQGSTYVVHGGGVTDCYAPRQTAEARNKCMGELAQMQRSGTSVVLDSACGSAGRSYVEPGVSFTPMDVRSSRRPWPDNSHSCTFSIQVQCCFVRPAPAQILQSAPNPLPGGQMPMPGQRAQLAMESTNAVSI